MNLELTSERLLLRPLAERDLDLCLEMFLDPEVLKYADGVMPETTIRRDLPLWTRRGGNGCVGIWCVCDRKSDEKFGTVALLPMPIDAHDTEFERVIPGEMPAGDIEVGYFLKRYGSLRAWGRK